VIGSRHSADNDRPQVGAGRSLLRVFARRRLGRLLPSRGRSVGPRTATPQLSTLAVAQSPPAHTSRALVSADEEEVAALVYELLDAHADTAELVTAYASAEQWQAHIEYLRALQRKGRETLARVGER
jgi:hypothetical protein